MLTQRQQNLFRDAVVQHYPNIPHEALEKIVHRETLRPQSQQLSPASYSPLAVASVIGFIRHNLTAYDTLLSRHVVRYVARDKVRHDVERYLILWS